MDEMRWLKIKYKLPATKGIMYGIPYIRRELATELGTRAPKRGWKNVRNTVRSRHVRE